MSETSSATHVLFTVPVGSSRRLDWGVAAYLAQIACRQDLSIEALFLQHRRLEDALNSIARDLRSGKLAAEWWLHMDADNPPRPGVDPLEDIALDADFVAFPTPVWAFDGPGVVPVIWNVYELLERNPVGWEQIINPPYRQWRACSGLQEPDAVGTGCFLAHRRVFEREGLEAPFAPLWNHDGTLRLGPDLAFSARAKDHGIRLLADFDRPCLHVNTVELTEAWMACSRHPKEE